MKSSIFDKEDFSILEFCNSLPTIIDSEGKLSEPNQIAKCYLLFRNDNRDYIKFLKSVREIQGIIYVSELTGKKISFRTILQTIDSEFNKLVIRIHTQPVYKDIRISWDNLEQLYTGFNKKEFEKWYKNFFSCTM